MMREVPDSNKKKSFKEKAKKFADTNLGITAILLAVIIPCITFWVWAATTKDWGVDLTGQNELGDAVGGITAPFIGITTSILTFLAFWVQYKFNKEQLEFNKNQDDFNKQQIDFNSKQILHSELQLVEAKVSSLNHTFDLLSKKELHVQDNYLVKKFTMFLHETTIMLHEFNIIPTVTDGYIELIIDSFVKVKYDSGVNRNVNRGKLISITDSVFPFVHFIKSLQNHLDEKIFDVKKPLIHSDYINKTFIIIPSEDYRMLFAHLIVISYHFSKKDINPLLSPSYEETEVFVDLHKRMFE